MKRRFVLVALGFAFGIFALNPSANAQQSCFTQGMSGVSSIGGQAPEPPIPANATVVDQGNWEVYWIVKNNQCNAVPECPT